MRTNEKYCLVCNQEWDLCECEQDKIMIKVGDTVTPKKRPLLKGMVKKINKDFNGKPLYILDNGTMHTEEEIKAF